MVDAVTMTVYLALCSSTEKASSTTLESFIIVLNTYIVRMIFFHDSRDAFISYHLFLVVLLLLQP
jgi:hypothetical protein